VKKDFSNPFKIYSDFKAAGDQPQAIEALCQGLEEGKRDQVLLGVTGSGKTFTMANVIERVNRPTLILAHNKTLAAQLYSEFKELFPNNAVEYFVSYYDYYQPEAYIPSTDTYIEKDSSINDEIDKLRHSATRSILERNDVIVVASVSCIYGLGSPKSYLEMMFYLKVGEEISRNDFIRKLIEINYTRNDIDFQRGSFRVRGDTVDIFPAYESRRAIRAEFFGDEITEIHELDPLTGARIEKLKTCALYPASHYVIPEKQKKDAVQHILAELKTRLIDLRKIQKHVEAQRLESKTLFDIEMLQEVGYCSGVENYSRHFNNRAEGEAAPTLIDFMPENWLLFIDESHISVSQVGGMYRGDRARKTNLVEHGFRLPSALDNRPLKFEEFNKYINQVIYVSATPADYELEICDGEVVEQIIRPTGLLDPTIEIRPATNQVDEIFEEAKKIIKKKERVLITTLTKKMSEDLSQHFQEKGIKIRYLHSDVDTLERVEILRDLRKGVFDVLVGINLLREGLDLPEVSLVAILDADKEGFLRSKTALIQTFGRAARNINGHVLLFADKMTKSMKAAIDESTRRREIQAQYNKDHGITPKSIIKKQRAEVTDRVNHLEKLIDELPQNENGKILSLKEIQKLIKDTEREMKAFAKDLNFEEAARLRDKVLQYKNWELQWINNTTHSTKLG